jgi:hypothetical protein
MSVPYASATTGLKAREEITKILRRFGASEIGFAENFERGDVTLYFVYRGRQVQLRASAKGWAQMFLKENPYTYRMRRTKQEHETDALQQGLIAVNSILRDWVKGQISAIETGILSFEAVFLPYMLTSDGRPLMERLAETGLLSEPTEPKVIALPQR